MKHFFDVGSNTGTTFDWLQTQPHDYSDHVIWCFEPSPRHFAALIEKVKSVRAKYNVFICPFAIAGKTAFRRCLEKDDPQGDSLHAWTASDHAPLNVYNGYVVQCYAVALSDAIFELTAADDEIVLDIDAEGEEYAMLSNLLFFPALMSRLRRVLVEWHFVDDVHAADEKRRIIAAFAAAGIAIESRGSVP